jgi:hypothetical protein
MAEQVRIVVTKEVRLAIWRAISEPSAAATGAVAVDESGAALQVAPPGSPVEPHPIAFTLDRQTAIDLMGALALATGAVDNRPSSIE